MLIFDMKGIEVLIPKHVIDQAGQNEESEADMIPFTSGKSKQILAYPNEWSGKFGDPFYRHEFDSKRGKEEFEQMSELPDSVPYKEMDINVTDRETIITEIEMIMKDMKEATADE